MPKLRWLLWLSVSLYGCDGLSQLTPGGGNPPNTGLTRDQHSAFFPINSGAHAAAECNSCHGGGNSFKDFSCVGCHEHDQSVIDPGHAGVPNYNYSGTSCYSCHPDGKAAGGGGAQHDMFFPITSGAHAGAACNTCHDYSGGSGNYTQYNCVNCHNHDQSVTDPLHPGVAGYIWNGTSCYTCHPQGTTSGVSRAQHDVTFPISTGSHAPFGCVDCHTDLSRTTDPSTLACASCHTGAHDQTVMQTAHQRPPDGSGGVGSIYTWTQSSCIVCHAKDIVVTRANHTSANNGGQARSGNHFRNPCSSCHPTTDFTMTTCMPCHGPGGGGD